MNDYAAFRADRDKPEPPSNIEAEQALLGAMLTRPDIIGQISGRIEPDHFFDPVHSDIFAAIMQKHGNRQTVDLVTIRAAMEHHAGLKELGFGYLAKMAGVAATSAGISDYAGLIVDSRCRREALQAAEGLQVDISGGVDTGEAVQRLLTALSALPRPGRETTISHLKAMTEAVMAANRAQQGDADLLKTGMAALDRIIGGLSSGDLCLLGGATSMGKSSVAIEIARSVSAPGGLVAFSSLEMAPNDIENRLIASQSSVPYHKARSGDFSEAEWRRWVGAAKQLESLALRIIPKHVRTLEGIRTAALKAQSEAGQDLKLLMVDYCQLIQIEGKHSRFEKQSTIPTELKAMAELFGCPVIGLVQLSRDIHNRPDPRPQLNDIKESGQYENDADQIVFCHRPEYFLSRRGPQVNQKGEITTDARVDHEAALSEWRNKMQLIAAKNRHGQTMTAEVGCHMGTNRFWKAGEEEPEDLEGFA